MELITRSVSLSAGPCQIKSPGQEEHTSCPGDSGLARSDLQTFEWRHINRSSAVLDFGNPFLFFFSF